MKAKLAIASLLILDVFAVFMAASALFLPGEYWDIPLPEDFRSKVDVHAMSIDDVWLQGIAMGLSRMLPSVLVVCSVLALHFIACVVLVRKLGKKS